MYLWHDLSRLAIHPTQALFEIGERRRLRDGLLAFGVVALLSTAVAAVGVIRPFNLGPFGGLLSLDATGLVSRYLAGLNQERFLLPFGVLTAAVVLFVLGVALVHWLAHRLGGRGTFAGYLKLAGYIALLTVVALPITAVEAVAGATGHDAVRRVAAAITPPLVLGVFLWQNLLYIVAARLHYSISTQRAVASVVGPIGCGIALVIGLVILSAALAVLRATS